MQARRFTGRSTRRAASALVAGTLVVGVLAGCTSSAEPAADKGLTVEGETTIDLGDGARLLIPDGAFEDGDADAIIAVLTDIKQKAA